MEHNNNNNTWTRRELIKTIAVLTGGAVAGGSMFLSGCKNKNTNNIQFTAAEIALLNEIGETILPTTNTPGAKAAKVGEFMQTMVKDCYTPAQQTTFLEGLRNFDSLSKKQVGKGFMELDVEKRKAFLVSLEKEAKPFDAKVADEETKERENLKKTDWRAEVDYQDKPRHYYTMMKQLTIFGFFSSKIGMTEVQDYKPVPGKYDGAYPFKKGDRPFC
jgi:hypothetical protein